MKKLGEILLQDGIISKGQLDKALKRQVTAGGRLGTNLVEMMLLDDVRLGQVLSRQTSIPDVHPKVLESIDATVLRVLPVALAEYYCALPFKLEGQRLHVAMLDPWNIAMVDELTHRSGFIIKPYICPESVLFRAMSIHYSIPPPMRKPSAAEVNMQDVIIRDNSGLISLDDDGQFTLVDKTDILGDRTKTLFLEASSKTEIVGYFLQFLGYNCDKVAFLAYDQDKNYLWRDVKSFQTGKKGIACGEQVNRSSFWNRYLSRPGFFYTRLPHAGNDMAWVSSLLAIDNPKGLFLAPLSISKKVIGVAIGASSAALRLEEEIETVKKLHLMAISALKIQEFKKVIENIS